MGQTIDTLKTSNRRPVNTVWQDSLYKNDSTQYKGYGSDTTQFKDTLTVRADTSAAEDSARAFRRVLPKNQMPLEPYGNLNYIIDKEQILFNDYSFTGELLERFPLSFFRSLGTLGQPHEVIVYGAGFNETSYLKDGLPLNNRLTNSFDLNNIQSESVDSIEIIPSPRGFLYGAFNNMASVNFISKETISSKERASQYTRLKYYQAEGDEAMVDFIYHSAWYRRLISTFEITNKTYNDPQTPRPVNSDYSLWNGTLKLKYLMSNSFNITGTYNYVRSDIGLYGGLTEMYLNNGNTINDGIDLNQADVYYENRGKRNTYHNLVLQLLGNSFSGNPTDIKAYYRNNLMEFQQNESDSLGSPNRIFDNNRSKLYGISFRQGISSRRFYFDFNSVYEINDYKTSILTADTRIKAFSFSGSAGLKMLDSSLIPSVFGKYLEYGGKEYVGIGADFVFRYSREFQFYAGLSQYEQPFNPVEEDYFFNTVRLLSYEMSPGLTQSASQEFSTAFSNTKKVKSFEAGIRFSYKDLNNSLSVFSRDITGDQLVLVNTAEADSNSGFRSIQRLNTNYWGIGASVNIKLWRLYLESFGAYYYNDRSNILKYKLPEYTFRGGLYYRDTLFNANLHLKAGIYAQYTGTQSFYAYDFEREMRGVTSAFENNTLNIPTVSPSLQLDFRLVGQVQERAILYFAVENILDNKYYLIPYYINPGMNLRIGISWEFLN